MEKKNWNMELLLILGTKRSILHCKMRHEISRPRVYEISTKAVLHDETVSKLMDAPQITNIENRELKTEVELPAGFKAVKVTYLFDPKSPYTLVDIIKNNNQII